MSDKANTNRKWTSTEAYRWRWDHIFGHEKVRVKSCGGNDDNPPEDTQDSSDEEVRLST
jgi:hypothetical protein